MDPAALALADADKSGQTCAASAPEAAIWIADPDEATRRGPTQAELLAAEPPWDGPMPTEYGDFSPWPEPAEQAKP